MVPTLETGDFILVNKFNYGVRLPIVNAKVIDVGAPKRGEVIVFRYPPQPTISYIKRVVGLPGDEIAYINKDMNRGELRKLSEELLKRCTIEKSAEIQDRIKNLGFWHATKSGISWRRTSAGSAP